MSDKIEKLNWELKKVQEIIDEPEMLSDLEFALNDAGNIELEIIELQKAIEILNNNKDAK